MRPYIICHMVTSIDGKVTGDFLSSPRCESAVEEYYRINRELPSQGFICGRTTMEESFTGGYSPELSGFSDELPDYEDYIAADDAERFAISIDPRGVLGWKSSHIIDDDTGYGGAHIVEVLCVGVKREYLAYLRSIGVSYIFAGEEALDIELALQKLRRLFDITTLLLEGGSVTNGAFLRAGCVDEISTVTAPLTAHEDGKPLFYDSVCEDYKLTELHQLKDCVWTRYRRTWSAW